MKRILLSLLAIPAVLSATAQTPDDVLRYSYFPQNGSARSMAIGGAMGSLGGDINALYVNPAGIGLYKTREFVLSPGWSMYNNQVNFRGTDQTTAKNNFNLGTTGLVLGFNEPGSKWTSQAFSIAVNQTANFNNHVSYNGSNNYSSYTEMFAEDITYAGASFDQVLNSPRFAYGAAPAVYTYLVDTFRTPSNDLVVKGLPEFVLESGGSLHQQKTIDTKGGIYEIALGYAANMDDKLYLGFSLGIPIISYTRNTYYRESDESGDNNNNFNYFELTDKLTTRGVGINAKLGMIYKPQMHWRLGLAIHTPTFYALTDKETSTLTADTEGYNGVSSASSQMFTNDAAGKTQYTATTPFKAIVSGSYVFNEVNDTRKQKAFITADIEYVSYRGTRFHANDEVVTDADNAYYDGLKSVIKSYYKNTFNYKLGGEIKFNTFMVRLGGAYYSNPYKDSELKSNIIQASGGIGYRNHGIFLDLTYAHYFTKDVNFPYRLVDKANTYAVENNDRGMIMLTAGFKF